jgi:hypothetical protein
MLGTPRRIRSRSLAARAALSVSTGVVALGCTEHDRPGMIADPQGDDPERSVTGSFRAPGAGSSGGAGGAMQPGSDGGTMDPASGAAGQAGVGAIGSGPVTLQQIYEGRCDGATVQWGFFTFQAATPGDSSIFFRLRTAAAEAELARGSFVDLLTASTALGTDRCGFAGPAPCPIDLYDVLGGAPLAHHPFAQLEVLLSPASEGGRMPEVEDWQLTYSCTFNQ